MDLSRVPLLAAAALLFNPYGLLIGDSGRLWGAEEAKVSIKSTYSTSTQKGLKPTSRAFRDVDGKRKYMTRHGYDLDVLYRNSQGMGASNVFLVRGRDLAEAVKSTRWVFTGGRPADRPATSGASSPADAPYWLVVYLGTAGSSPAHWQAEQTTIGEDTIQFAYRPSKGAETHDVHQYFYWVPLGKLKPATYHLELFDSKQRSLTLMRRIVVKK